MVKKVNATPLNILKILWKLNLMQIIEDNLPLNKPLKLHLLTIIVRCIFEELLTRFSVWVKCLKTLVPSNI